MLVDTSLVVGVDRAESRLDRVIRLPLQVAHQLLNSAERVYFCIKQIAEPRFEVVGQSVEAAYATVGPALNLVAQLVVFAGQHNLQKVLVAHRSVTVGVEKAK